MPDSVNKAFVFSGIVQMKIFFGVFKGPTYSNKITTKCKKAFWT